MPKQYQDLKIVIRKNETNDDDAKITITTDIEQDRVAMTIPTGWSDQTTIWWPRQFHGDIVQAMTTLGHYIADQQDT